jgi:hypothetical protein
MEIEYIETTLDNVLDYYARGFSPKEKNKRIYRHEATCDTRTGKVIFKLTIENTQPKNSNEQ